ncbi:MAG: VOC family protein [Rhodanobacteraceae bacterium]
MPTIRTIAPCHWFDHRAEDAARFYTSIFPDPRIVRAARDSAIGKDIHGVQPGSVMFIDFDLAGQHFGALNAGTHFKFSPAISRIVYCDTQEEIDRYWETLSEGGAPEAQRCGRLADRSACHGRSCRPSLARSSTTPIPRRE